MDIEDDEEVSFYRSTGQMFCQYSLSIDNAIDTLSLVLEVELIISENSQCIRMCSYRLLRRC